MQSVNNFPVCDYKQLDYSLLINAIHEVLSGHSFLTCSSLMAADVTVDATKYTRWNSYIPKYANTSHGASVSIVDGELTCTGYAIVGDTMINADTSMLACAFTDKLLGDQLAQAYFAMANGDNALASAFVKVVFLLIRLISENQAPSLSMSDLEGVTPYAL